MKYILKIGDNDFYYGSILENNKLFNQIHKVDQGYVISSADGKPIKLVRFHFDLVQMVEKMNYSQ